MKYEGFIGGSYLGQAVSAAADRSVNLFPEFIGPGHGKNQMWLTKAPGRKVFATIADPPVRGLASGYGRCFVAGSTNLWELTAAGTLNNLGTYNKATTPVKMFFNGLQLFLTSGNLGWLQDGVNLTQVVPGVYPAFIDGYFVAQQQDSNQFRLSDNAPPIGVGGLKWDPLQFGTKEAAADRLVATVADHDELWLIGDRTTEVWYNSGAALFPFQRVQSALIEQGCIAPWSVAQLDNSLFWLGGDYRGDGVVWRMQGYLPTRVSTHAMEAIIQSYPTISDAIAYAYQENGHSFYVIVFPSGNATWVLDTATGFWHERGIWNAKSGNYDADPAPFHAFEFGMHLVGDMRAGNGNIYQQSADIFSDAAQANSILRWLRAAPHIDNELKWNYFQRLVFDMMAGGNNPGVPDPFRNSGGIPQISLRFSDDGGFSWNNPVMMSAGAIGQYRFRIERRQLGRSRDRVFEISGTDPVQIAIIDAYLDLVPETVRPPAGSPEGPAITTGF